MKSRKLIYIPIIVLAMTIVLFFAGVLALSRPSIQTKVVKKITNIISKRIDLPVEIGSVNISWFDEAILKDLSIRDTQGQEMIAVKQLNLNFSLASLLARDQISLDQARLHGAQVTLQYNAPDSVLNISWFVKKLRDTLSGERDGKKRKSFSIDRAILRESSFSLNNMFKDSLSDRWDYSHFYLTGIEAELEDLKIHQGAFEVDVRRLDCFDEQTKMAVSDLNTFFSISQSSMQFKNLEMNIGSSRIRNDMIFTYENMASLTDFNFAVNIEAALGDSRIFTKDLGWFAPYFSRYNEFFEIQGKFKGAISRFFFEDFRVSFGEKSILEGNVNITGLPQYEEALFDIDLNDSYLAGPDFKNFLPSKTYEKIRQLGYLNVKDINLTGFLYDFVAQGSFLSPLGSIRSDINLKLHQDAAYSSYSGSLALSDFNLGKLVNEENWIQKVDMTGEVEGKGLQMENADFQLKAFFNYFDFKQYRYKNISADARFARELFNGNLVARDENLKLQASALIDLREDLNKVTVKAHLDTAFLQNLKLTDEDFFVSSDIDVDVTGLKPDELIGEIKLSGLYLSKDNRDMNVDYLELVSQKNEGERRLSVNSDLLSLKLSGNFNYSDLIRNVKKQYDEYKLIILNQNENIKSYYAKKPEETGGGYSLTYSANLKNINPLISLFSASGYISHGAEIAGALSGGDSSLFSFYSQIDTISYGHFNFYGNLIDLKIGKESHQDEVDAFALIRSGHQSLNRIERGEKLESEISWKGKHVVFSTGVGLNGGNSVFLSGNLDFLENKTRIVFDSSSVNILGKSWVFSNDNETVVEGRTVRIRGLKLYHEEQSISLNGSLSADSTQRALAMDISNFLLTNLNPILKKDFSGKMDGRINIGNQDDPFGMEGRVRIGNFMIEKFPVGDIDLDSYWNRQLKHLNIDLDVYRKSDRIIVMNGFFDPDGKEEQLHMYARLNKASLNISEPFIQQYFSRINGFVSGEFSITGALSRPEIVGKGLVEQGKVKVNYLNTDYSFYGEVTMDQNRIGVDNLVVHDDEMNRARLSGGFYHSGLRNFVMDLNGRLNNFKVLNTTARDNRLYYGVAMVTGNVEFLGAPANLNISANATTEKGTKIFIPLNESSTIEQENFIRFKSSNDTTAAEEDVNKIDLKGLKMNFDLEVTPDAYCELIFDIKAGDIIRGRGEGRLKLHIDTEGDFRMFGDYEIMEGGYNFTLYNVINKEFNITPNSAITWTGDPYKAQMNIKATYEQMASFAPLLDSALAEHPDIKRKYPAKVLLDLKGDLMSPEINFDIEIVDYPSMIRGLDGGSYLLEADIIAFRNKIRTDEQELKRQVFSLMALRRFSPENSFNVSGSLGNSVSEFISNQLSYWITQFDENLEIDVDLNSLDQEAFNTFQLRLSYTTLGGRLRITRDGGFTNQQNQTSFGAIAGDWTVEYLLSPNGKLRVKMYNKTNYNPVNASLERQSTTTAGFSLLHTESFDKLKEVFMNIKNKERQEERRDETTGKTTPAVIRDDMEAQADPGNEY